MVIQEIYVIRNQEVFKRTLCIYLIVHRCYMEMVRVYWGIT